MQGRQLAAQKKRDKRIAEGNTGMKISEVPRAAYKAIDDFIPEPTDVQSIAEGVADLRKVQKGISFGSVTGALLEDISPLPKGLTTTLGGGVGGAVGYGISRGKRYLTNMLEEVFDKRVSKEVLEMAGTGGKQIDGDLTPNVLKSENTGSEVGKSNVTNLPPQGMSTRNHQLFKNLGFEDWEQYFVGAWEDLADPISRNFNAAVSNDKYSWNTFDRVRRETLPLVMEEYAGIADIKWPRKGPELHHINAIKATMPLFEGLARNERKELLKVLMREGIYAGHDPNNLMQLPHAVHKSVTKLWNDKIGKSGKLFFERDKDGLFKAAQLPFEERKILAKNYAKVVKDLELTTLKMAKDYKAISKESLARKLDKELKKQFNIANFEHFILTGKYLGDEVSPEVKQIFKSRSVKNIKKRTKK